MKKQFIPILLSIFLIAFSAKSQNHNVPSQCLAATSETNYKELNKVSNAKDQDALMLMFKKDRAVVLEANTKVFRLDGIITYKVRVLNGKHKDRILFIAAEFCKKTK